MNLKTLTLCTTLAAGTLFSQDTGLLATVVTADRAVSPINQTLTGTWVALARRAAPPGTPVPPPAPVVFTFHSDGTVTGVPANGAATSLAGTWIRVAEGKFLVTYVTFNFNEARVLTDMAKVRMTTQISSDGLSLAGNQEVLVMDPEGKPTFTALGGSHNMVRLSPERPADFDAFLGK